jgi:dTMP kinase
MPFIVIEGLDGAGGQTQTDLLKEVFKMNKVPFSFVKSPDYKHPVGQLFSEYLTGKVDLTTEQVFLLCAMDVLNSVPKIKKGLKEDHFVIADRYITSTLAYRDAKGFPTSKGLKLIELLDFPKADLIIFLDIKPETSMKRKREEKGNLDIHEQDAEYLRKVRESYHKEIDKNIMGKWVVIDGEKSIKDVNREILKLIKKHFKSRLGE